MAGSVPAMPKAMRSATRGPALGSRVGRFYQPFLKHRRPNGPGCQPIGQLYIGRQPP